MTPGDVSQYMARLMREDSYHRRDLRDPEFTVQELAKASGATKAEISRQLLEAGIGRVRCRNGIREKVVKWSELVELAAEFSWLGKCAKS